MSGLFDGGGGRMWGGIDEGRFAGRVRLLLVTPVFSSGQSIVRLDVKQLKRTASRTHLDMP